MLVFCDSRAPETLPWGKVTLTDEVPPGYHAQQGAPRTRGPGQEPPPEGRNRSSLGPAMSHVTVMGAGRRWQVSSGHGRPLHGWDGRTGWDTNGLYERKPGSYWTCQTCLEGGGRICRGLKSRGLLGALRDEHSHYGISSPSFLPKTQWYLGTPGLQRSLWIKDQPSGIWTCLPLGSAQLPCLSPCFLSLLITSSPLPKDQKCPQACWGWGPVQRENALASSLSEPSISPGPCPLNLNSIPNKSNYRTSHSLPSNSKGWH